MPAGRCRRWRRRSARPLIAQKLVEIARIEQATPWSRMADAAGAARSTARPDRIRAAGVRRRRWLSRPATGGDVASRSSSPYAGERRVTLPVECRRPRRRRRRRRPPAPRLRRAGARSTWRSSAACPVGVNGVTMPLRDLIGSLDMHRRRARRRPSARSALLATRAHGRAAARGHRARRWPRPTGSSTASASGTSACSSNGAWFTPLREALDAYVEHDPAGMSCGIVRLKLFDGALPRRCRATQRRRTAHRDRILQ